MAAASQYNPRSMMRRVDSRGKLAKSMIMTTEQQQWAKSVRASLHKLSALWPAGGRYLYGAHDLPVAWPTIEVGALEPPLSIVQRTCSTFWRRRNYAHYQWPVATRPANLVFCPRSPRRPLTGGRTRLCAQRHNNKCARRPPGHGSTIACSLARPLKRESLPPAAT